MNRVRHPAQRTWRGDFRHGLDELVPLAQPLPAPPPIPVPDTAEVSLAEFYAAQLAAALRPRRP